MAAPASLTRQTVFLTFDVESNGLHGNAFAVAGLLIRADGEVLEEFTARCPIVGEVDAWVKKNVLKPLATMAEDTQDEKALRDKFWTWFKAAREKADYVLVNNGYPVEYRFLIACQDDDIEARYWEHPFPVIEVSSLFLAAGIKILTPATDLIEDKIAGQTVLRHHPLWDAKVSALAAIAALERTGQLS
jgi:hypothetical protein